MITQQWLADWAATQVYQSNEQMSRVCFKQILPAIEPHPVRFGPNADQTAYIVHVTGFEPVTINPQS
jgi:hypothetical protein